MSAMSTIFASMQQVSLPRFASAGGSGGGGNDAIPRGGGDNSDAANKGQQFGGNNMLQSADDQLDFDLLAEYLLDDGTSAFPPYNNASGGGGGGGQSESVVASVSPPELDYQAAAASQADPLADAHAQLATGGGMVGVGGQVGQVGVGGGGTGDIASDLAQVQQIIAAHAARAQQTSAGQQQQQGGGGGGGGGQQARMSPTASGGGGAPVTQAPPPPQPAPTQQPLQQQQLPPPQAAQHPVVPVHHVQAPAPSAPLMHPGMSVLENAGVPVSAPHPGGAPMPASAAPVNMPTMIVHQHSAPVPAAVVSTTTSTTPPVSAAVAALNTMAGGGGGGSTTKRPFQVPTMDMGGQKRQKTQAQISRRRERNRILARRTRLRKKFFFESLQKEVTDLQRENNALKEIIKRKLDQTTAGKVLEECKIDLPNIVLESCGDATELDRQDFSLIKSLQGSQQCFVITDPSLQDNPIVYASEGFLGLTGYGRDEVLGRNCRFLQGTETSPAKVETLKKATSVGEDVSVCLINYTADGTPFWNQLFIAALRDANNNIVNFVGVLVRVSGPSPDDPEHGKLLPGQEEGDLIEGEDPEDGDCGEEEDNNHDAGAYMSEGAVDAISDAVSAAVDAAPDMNGHVEG